jgi:hypothetical protein
MLICGMLDVDSERTGVRLRTCHAVGHRRNIGVSRLFECDVRHSRLTRLFSKMWSAMSGRIRLGGQPAQPTWATAGPLYIDEVAADWLA